MSIKITEVRNAKSLNAENTRFDVEINHPQYGWIPYTLNPHDTDQTVNNDELLALIGSDFEAADIPTPEEEAAILAREVRRERNRKLREEVDIIVRHPLRWDDLTAEQKSAWATYRTDLLNVPQQASFPHIVTWPDKPE